MPTTVQYKRRLMRAMDDLAEYTVSTANANVCVIPALINADADASDLRIVGRWIYVVSGTGAGEQRQVIAYAPSTGTLTVTPPWSGPAGGVVHLTGYFPSGDGGTPQEDTSYREIIDRSCALIGVPDRVRVLKNGTDTQATTLWPWLDRHERLLGPDWLLETSPIPGHHPISAMWRGPRLVFTGTGAAIELDAPDLDPGPAAYWYIEAIRPGNTWINGAENETGLVLDADVALPTIEDVAKVGTMLAYEALMNRSPGRPSGDYVKRWAAAREVARRVRYYDMSQERPEPAAAQEVA